MRIIRGIYGRRRFQVPPSFKARPTTDFAKENLFNVLENLVEWDDLVALDLFSGTGSIAFELLSRGCRRVVAVESDGAHAAFIAKVAQSLNASSFNLIRSDVFRYIHTAPQSYNFIFADPPYALPQLAELPRLLLDGPLLETGGMLVVEHPKQYDFSSDPMFVQLRTYGSVHFSFFVKAAERRDA